MARYVFNTGSVTNSTGHPITVKFYPSETSSHEITQLHLANQSGDPGEAVANGRLVIGTDGVYPALVGPEGAASLWVDVLGTRTEIQASTALDAASTRAALGLGAAATKSMAQIAADPTVGAAISAAIAAARPACQFHVADYGAVGDGKVIYDVAMTSGSAVCTSATAGFTSADVGKKILVNGAGPGGGGNPSGALITTIASRQSATQVTLAATSSGTISGCHAVYGTDDTAAIQDAMLALQQSDAFSLAGGGMYAELIFDPLIYVLATPPVPGGPWPGNATHGFAQIPLPVIDTTGEKNKPTIVIKGQSDNSVLSFWHQQRSQITGPCLFSMNDASSNDPTYGPPSVIGGPTITSPFTHSYNNILCVIDGIQVVSPYNPGQIAFDFIYTCQMAIKTASADVFAPVIETGNNPSIRTLSTNAGGVGLRVPRTGLNDRLDIGSFSCEGYYIGMYFDEHVSAQRVAIIYTRIALYMDAIGGNQLTHGCWIGYASTEICDYCLYVGGNSASSLFGIEIGMLDNEDSVLEHIHDPTNFLTGRVNVLPSGSQDNPVSPTVNGAGNLEVISMGQRRGAVTAPAVPATTVPLQNPFWRHAAVTVTGGTVTAIEVDGAATGLTAGTVIVPSGKTITLTHSSAPSWTWVLL